MCTVVKDFLENNRFCRISGNDANRRGWEKSYYLRHYDVMCKPFTRKAAGCQSTCKFIRNNAPTQLSFTFYKEVTYIFHIH